jgi:hypothetical protein
MMIIAEEWPSEIKHGKAIEKLLGDHNPRIHETLAMWKILSLTRTADQAQEEDSHPEVGEQEEDPSDSRIITQKTRTFIVSTMEEDTALKGAQKPRRKSQEFSKRKL